MHILSTKLWPSEYENLNAVVIPGSKTIDHIKDNLNILDFKLTDEDSTLLSVGTLFRKNDLQSMYGGFEQVGSLGTSLPKNDRQTTTSSGDKIVTLRSV